MLHHRHGLGLDEEVAYVVTLAATSGDVTNALALGGITVDQHGDLASSR